MNVELIGNSSSTIMSTEEFEKLQQFANDYQINVRHPG